MDTEQINQETEAENTAHEAALPETESQSEDWRDSAFAGMEKEEGGNNEEVTPEGQAEDAAHTKEENTQEQPGTQKPEEDESLKEPEGLSEKASERFRALANEAKALREEKAEWQQVSESVRVFQESVRESFNDVQEVENLFAYGKAVKNGDWDTVEQILSEQVRQFEVMSGKRLSVDLVSKYDDLQQRLESFEMDEEQAREIAQARYLREMQQQAFNEQRQLEQQQRQQLAAEQQQLEEERRREAIRNQAIADVNQLCAEYAKTDVFWPEREQRLAEFARSAVASLPPESWASTIKAFYDGIKNNTPTKGGAVPIRAGTPAAQASTGDWRQDVINQMNVG